MPASPNGDRTEGIDLARVLDAACNRAREGLRVVEDYCRFVLDDALLCGECKRLRHDLTEAVRRMPGSALLAARETVRDVGAEITTAAEASRPSLLAVAQANSKRAQEALRSIEEFGKVSDPALGVVVERLRYRSYTLERAVVLGTKARERLEGIRLYVLVTGDRCAMPWERTIQEAVAGGAGVIQLREKNWPDRDLLERARTARRVTREAGAIFIVNDRPDIARLVEADGVHLGQEEMSVKDARRIVGPDALIGVSTHDLDQVRRAVLDGASYIGIGPTFTSGTKSFEAFPGLAFIRQATAATSLPTFAIGGIKPATIPAVAQAGARRVAVSEAVCGSAEPKQAAMELIEALGMG